MEDIALLSVALLLARINNTYMLKNTYPTICIILLSLAFALTAAANDTISDEFLTGYLTRILENELGWERASYHLTVRGGIATVVLINKDPQHREELETRVPEIKGLKKINILVQTDERLTESPATTLQQIYSFLGVRPETTPFPVSGLFLPLLADPKQPQFFVSYRRYETPIDTVNIGAVGFGESFGFYRQEGKQMGDGLQISIAGGLFAQFDMDAPSSDLINADYIIGIPITYRRESLSMRLRVYHQSSHLGDEFLLNVKPERVNLSFESVELLAAYQIRNWRGYFGGEYLFSREPSDLKPNGLHGGMEFLSKQPVLFGERLVGGLDLKSWEQHDWSVDASLKVGMEFGKPREGYRQLRIMLEVYDGHSPHGQFYDTQINYVGLGAYLGF